MGESRFFVYLNLYSRQMKKKKCIYILYVQTDMNTKKYLGGFRSRGCVTEPPEQIRLP